MFAAKIEISIMSQFLTAYGFVFKTGDYDSFVTAIKRLEEIDLNEMQKNIINTFHLNDYSMESHIKGLIDIYGD